MSASPVTLEQTRCYEKPNRFQRPRSYIFSPRGAMCEDRCVFQNMNFARHYAAETASEGDSGQILAQPGSRQRKSIFADQKCVDTSMFVPKAHAERRKPRSAALSCLSQYEKLECSSLCQLQPAGKQSLQDLLTQSISAFAEQNGAAKPQIRPLSRPRLSDSTSAAVRTVQKHQAVHSALDDAQSLEATACQPFSDSELSDILCVGVQEKTIRPPPVIRSHFLDEYAAERAAELPRPEVQPSRPARALSGQARAKSAVGVPAKSRALKINSTIERQPAAENDAEQRQQRQRGQLETTAKLSQAELIARSSQPEAVIQPSQLGTVTNPSQTQRKDKSAYNTKQTPAVPEAYPGFDHSLQSLDGSDLCMLLDTAKTGENASMQTEQAAHASLEELKQQLDEVTAVLAKLQQKTFTSKQDDIDLKKHSIRARALQSEIAKRRRENGAEARRRAQGAAQLINAGVQQVSRFAGGKKHRAPERRGNYVYRVLDTVLDSVQIIARTDLQTQQTKYFRVPRLKFVELVRQGLFQRGAEYSALQSRECVVQAQVESTTKSLFQSQARQ